VSVVLWSYPKRAFECAWAMMFIRYFAFLKKGRDYWERHALTSKKKFPSSKGMG
jgi:hypothetical protein